MVIVIIAGYVAVNRGEALAHAAAGHDGGHAEVAASAGGPQIPFVPDRDPNVLEILGLAVVLFTLVMGGLLGFSILSQM